MFLSACRGCAGYEFPIGCVWVLWAMADDLAPLIDTRALAKPTDFSGQDGDWTAWKFGFISYVGLISSNLESNLKAHIFYHIS